MPRDHMPSDYMSSDDMYRDQLSEAFDLVEVRGMVTGGFAVNGPWVTRTVVDDPVKFFAMASGNARLTTDGVDGATDLEPGDVAILSNRSWLELRGGAGDRPAREIVPTDASSPAYLAGADRETDDVLIGARIDLNSAGRALLLHALPPVAHVRAAAATATTLRDNLDRLFDEVTKKRIGSAFAVRQYGQLLVLEILRAYVNQYALPAGWLRALTDRRLQPALTLMHTEPGKRWNLAELARAAAMSRTSFAEHFRAVAGVPPLAYLSRWRMMLARRALRDVDVRVGSLASELGYSSEGAFSNAFKREVGVSPLRYRARMREGRINY